ncbi:unnamed protein product [Prorocentrum cordatum]|uniref:Protein xylosyltransferase n=1 Tax=Prorocentrum cordatum TaxID=2364126 RepID=A0ABN9Y2M2_9DINO|nr:unnamed protein product [Polarella glacialis]
MDADFSSPDPDAGARANASVAVCVLGAPRSIHETYASIQRYVVKAVAGNAFIYVPFPKLLSRTLEGQVLERGWAGGPKGRASPEERLNSELYDPRISGLYTLAPGPWRAPLYGQMGSSMWGYHNQHACQRMVTAHEEQRGQLYEWVIFARADMLWLHNHPPIGVLDPRFVYVPFGQDNSFYANGSEPGLNDRHAAVPRALVPGYFGRWDALRSGRAWPEYLGGVAEADVESPPGSTSCSTCAPAEWRCAGSLQWPSWWPARRARSASTSSRVLLCATGSGRSPPSTLAS